MKKRCAYIDHSFKIKSQSSRFLIDILEKHYDVEQFWDDSWNNGPRVDLEVIAGKTFDIIVFFQQINYEPDELQMLNCEDIIFIPMYDGAHFFPDSFFQKFQGIKFLNFSKTFHDRLIGLGLSSEYFQYFPNPNNFKVTNLQSTDLSGFFWQRYDLINWGHIMKLIGDFPFKKFHLHLAIDPPGYPVIMPGDEEKSRLNITISEWFKTRDEYYEVLKSTDVFFAPRVYEGIGMSFLEAMAMGKCVVAPDTPTMNEYIAHNVNGFLYNLDNPQPLVFENLEEIRRNARSGVERGYTQWINSSQRLFNYFETPVSAPEISKSPSKPQVKSTANILKGFLNRLMGKL
jgi:glycosyltransferase involved in cell wall biosynthesis